MSAILYFTGSDFVAGMANMVCNSLLAIQERAFAPFARPELFLSLWVIIKLIGYSYV